MRATSLDNDGYVLERGIIGLSAVVQLRDEVESIARDANTVCSRDLLRRSETIYELAIGDLLHSLLEPVLGPFLLPVRAILFDKTKDKNWPVLWHQDLSIAVRERMEIVGFGPWSEKDGVVHVQPPVEVLESMVTARIHLDPADETNGTLKVITGSHKSGILSEEEIGAIAGVSTAVSCSACAGDVLLMRPLLLHSSARSRNPGHRRVIHIEYASAALPAPLEWEAANVS